MTPRNELRLLPWSGLDGKPCYLSTDDSGGYLSRVADNIEAVQLGMAGELVQLAAEALNDQDSDLEQMRCLSRELARALGDVLRVATRRGQDLAQNEPDL